MWNAFEELVPLRESFKLMLMDSWRPARGQRSVGCRAEDWHLIWAPYWEVGRREKGLQDAPAFQRALFPNYVQKVQIQGSDNIMWTGPINHLLIRCVLWITSPRGLPRTYVTGICPFLQLETTWVGLICLLDQHNQRLLFKLYWLHKRCSFLPLELWSQNQGK